MFFVGLFVEKNPIRWTQLY